MKRRVISLLVALMMLFSAAAFAETAADSTMNTLALYDPVIYVNGEAVLDMTGLELDLGLAVSDSGTNSVMIELLAGENYDFLTGAYVQLDANGLSFCLDGMSNVYTVNIDEYLGWIDPSLEGMTVGQLATMLPVRTLLNSVDLSGLSFDFDVDLSGEARFALVEAVAGLLAAETTVNGDVTEYALAITAEQSRELAAMLVEALEEQNMDLDDFDVDSFALELSGKLTSGATQEMNLTGKLWFDYAAGRYADVTVSYTDDKMNANLNVNAVNHVDANDTASIVGTAVSTAGADGSISTECNVLVDVLGEAVQFYAAQIPVEGSAQIDYSVGAYVPAEESGIDLYWSTGMTAGTSLYAEVVITEGDEATGFYGYCEGDTYVDESIGDYFNSYLQLGMYDNEESVDIVTYLLAFQQDLAIADWAFDSTGAIDLLTMSETDASTALMGLMGVIGDVIPALQAAVPGLAPILESAAASLMG